MGRWRAPQKRSSAYITRAGFRLLQDEQQSLWSRRRLVTAALSAAAAEGDRSENAEYIYRKKELQALDRRIRYLQKRLPDLKVVEQLPEHTDKVFFGALVTLLSENGESACYRIVGADELDFYRNGISADSPLARALLGRQVDTDIEVWVESRCSRYAIVDISYLKPTPDDEC